jgi:hypothetical protein
MKVVHELLGHATDRDDAHLSPDVPHYAVKLLDGIGSAAARSPVGARQLGDNAPNSAQLAEPISGGAGSRTHLKENQNTKRFAGLHKPYPSFGVFSTGRLEALEMG